MHIQHKVFAVIAAFNPTDKLLHLVDELLNQVRVIIIVNDNPYDSNLEYMIESQFPKSKFFNIVFMQNKKNLGIAFTLNQGVKYSMQEGATHVITFDQDSRIYNSCYIDQLLNSEKEALKLNIKVGTIAPKFIGSDLNGQDFSPINSEISISRFPIQSGLLIPIETFKECGLFDESLFIDAVDTEYYLRIERKIYKNITSNKTKLHHQIGKQLSDKHINKKYSSSHSPIRHYYISRNRIIVSLKYEKSFLRIIKYIFISGWKRAYMDGKYNNNIMSYIKMVTKGKIDGIQNKKGKFLRVKHQSE